MGGCREQEGWGWFGEEESGDLGSRVRPGCPGQPQFSSVSGSWPCGLGPDMGLRQGRFGAKQRVGWGRTGSLVRGREGEDGNPLPASTHHNHDDQAPRPHPQEGLPALGCSRPEEKTKPVNNFLMCFHTPLAAVYCL